MFDDNYTVVKCIRAYSANSEQWYFSENGIGTVGATFDFGGSAVKGWCTEWREYSSTTPAGGGGGTTASLENIENIFLFHTGLTVFFATFIFLAFYFKSR